MRNGSRRGVAGMLAVCAALAAGGASAAPTQAASACDGEPNATVPAFVLSAAAFGTVADFARALAAARVCAGFVVPRTTAGTATASWRHQPVEPRVRLSQVLAAFEPRHVDLVVERVGTVLLIRDRRRERDAAPLNRIVGRVDLIDVPAIEAFRRVLATLTPSDVPIGGSVGSALGMPEEPPFTAEDFVGPLVSTSLANKTLLDALVDLANRAPGVVWMLRVPDATDGASVKTSDLTCYLPRGITAPIGDVPLSQE